MHQKEERFQVIIDVIKNSMCFKAFTISAEVPKIFMKHFWYTIKKIQGTNSYEFVLANKRLKFVRIGEDYQEYGLLILDMMLNNEIKQSDSYQMFLKYSTGLIPPKKSRGKGSQGKKIVDVSQESVDVSDEYEPEPELAKKKTGSRTEQEAADTMQALKESKKNSRRQPSTRGLSKGTGRILGVSNESTVVSAILSEGTGTKPGVSDEEKVTSKVNVILEWGSKNESEHSEDSQLNSDEEKKKIMMVMLMMKMKMMTISVTFKMVEAETVERENKEKDEMTNAAKADVEKTAEEKGDAELAKNAMISDYQVKESTELPLPSSSLSVSSGFGTHFLNLSSDVSLTGVLKDSAEVEISSLMDVHIQQETSQIQSLSVLKVPVSVIPETTTLPPIPKIPTETLVSTALSPPHITPTISILRVAKLEKDVSELKKIDHSAEALAFLKSQVPTVVEHIILDPKLVMIFKKSKKSASEIRKIKKEQAEKQKMPKNPANHALYHALIEALIEDENAMDKGVTDTVKNHKRQHDDDDDDPSAGPNQGKKRRTKELESSMKPSTTKETSKGKAPSKSSKTGNSATTKKLIKEPIAEENKRQVVTDQPEQPWFNYMVYAVKDPLKFNKLMATPIEFSKYAMNRLKIDHLTQEILVGPIYNLLKGTCTSSIKLEYNMEECFKALTDKLDWNNPKGDRFPFELTKSLPLKGHPGHLTVAAKYFFSNDIEFLKSSDPEKNYTTSITKTKTSRYEIMGIEDTVPTLWSPIKYGYDKDAEKEIKYWGERRKLCVKKLHGYDHLEEIIVKRADRRLHKFKEGDFVNLHLNDIEDMILLVVQHEFFHLDGSDNVDFIVALCMFTRSLIIKRRVEDLQLGVESYQKKLNITTP
ncbi:hypothetical protein Tco_0597525 [Tanacetum coccineum]